MKQGKKSFRHESLQDRRSVRAILEALVEGIDKGRIRFSDDDDEILMEPAGLLHLKLRATQEEERHRLTLRISWQVEGEGDKGRRRLRVTAD
ncbi:MAG TPA: amphi-Trp domain-containing protein [Sedimenticola thiotaurini]|uniref:Amphi-Trp domain-containing protein n=1 Tax=Sedimenticola thiotaurini TaxID=1543721 RepID=A0A831RJJ4_9GAMM|nr:amphi-Trp domain-containing protein [Sedimenticola thiotaurini]